jgi:glycerophosphoryl diester phosphodiesterase
MTEIQTTWKQALKHFTQSWRQVLLTHFAFTALSVILFAPLVGLTGRLLLKLSGQTVLADQDIAYFLFSPVGLIALIIFSALLVAVLAFEQAAIMRIALAAIQEKRLSPFDALLYTATRAHKLWLFTARLVIRILTLAIPPLAIAALIAWYLISDYDINFYLSEKPPEFWTAVILISAVLVALLIVLMRKLAQWSMALPLVLFGNTSPALSFAESTRITQGHRKAIFLVLLSWAGLSLVLGMIVLGAMKMLGHWTIPIVAESLSLAVLAIGGLVVLWGAANVLITAFTSGTFAYLLMDIYARLGPASNLDVTGEQERRVTKVSLRFTPKTLAVTIISVAIIAGISGIWLMNGIPTNNEVIIVAHRGAAGKAPENTMASIEQAIEDGADWIEIDVQETADGEIVVIHDSDFMKLAGKPLKIWDATRAQLEDIDIGSWFDPRFSEERVPGLKRVLDTARGKAKVVIELKYYGYDEDLEQRVIDIVEHAKMVEETAIMSLKYNAIEKIRVLRPDWIVGLLSATAIGDLSRLDTDFLAVAMGMASPGFIDRAHRAGRQVFVWTVNDPVSMSRMISLNVDGIITDEPELAKRVLSERAEMSTVQRLLIHASLLFGDPYTPNQYRDESP